MKLYLIRHGQTYRNQQKDMIGQAPEEKLSSKGIEQAHLLGNRLLKDKIEFKEIYCSPYERAIMTAKIACPTQKLTIVEDLREYSAGEATDKTRGEVITFDVLNEMNELGMHFAYPSGETLYEVEKRVAKWLYGVMQQYKNDDCNIAVFSHGMTIKCLFHYILHFDHKITWRINLTNTSVSILEFKLDHWFLDTINDTRHLYKENDK